MINRIDHLVSHVDALGKYYGAKQADAYRVETAADRYCFRVVLETELDVVDGSEVILEAYKAFTEMLRGSQFYTNDQRLKDLMINELREQLQEAKTEIVRLTPYEQHFQVEMRLRHGLNT